MIMTTAEESLNDSIIRLERLRSTYVQFTMDTRRDGTSLNRFQEEIDALLAEVGDILMRAEFNRTPLFSGAFSVDRVDVNGRAVDVGLRIPRVDLAMLRLYDVIKLSRAPYEIPLADSPEYGGSRPVFRTAVERHLDRHTASGPPFAADTTAAALADLLNAQIAPDRHLTAEAVDSFFDGRFNPSVHVALLNGSRTDAQNIGSIDKAIDTIDSVKAKIQACMSRCTVAIASAQLNPEAAAPTVSDADLAKKLLGLSLEGAPLETAALDMLAQTNDAEEAERLRRLLR